MVDETSTGTEQTLDITDGVLNLLPPKNGVVYQLLRLGLTFDHADNTGETWANYNAGLQAQFADRDAQKVTLTDMDTKNTAVIPLDVLEKVNHIQTWRAPNPPTTTTDSTNETA